jgi:hypothetical protein
MNIFETRTQFEFWRASPLGRKPGRQRDTNARTPLGGVRVCVSTACLSPRRTPELRLYPLRLC